MPKMGAKSNNTKQKVEVNIISTGNSDNCQKTLMSVWNKLKEKAGLQASSDTDGRNNMVVIKPEQEGEKQKPDGHVEV